MLDNIFVCDIITNKLILEVLQMKKVLSIVLVIFMLVGLSGCFGSSNDYDSNSSKYELVEQVRMTSEYDSYLGYSVTITGKLKNTSNKSFSYCSVTFAIYDENGNQIETAMDSINYLQAGSIWSFTAEMFTWTKVYPKSCKLVSVSAW